MLSADTTTLQRERRVPVATLARPRLQVDLAPAADSEEEQEAT